VEIEDGVTVESDLVGIPYQELDRVLVVQNHLRFEMRAPFGLLAQLDETLGVEQRVGVASRRLEFHDRSINSLLRICLA